MPHPNSSGRVLAGIAETLYAYDPDGAERISTSPNYPDYALGQLVSTAVAHDPDHAERLARKIPDTQSRISAQARIAAAVAAYDPARARRLIVDAERTARTIADPAASAWALRDVVVRMVGVNPDNSRRLFGEAKRIADSITDPQEQAAAWTAAAKAIAEMTPRKPGSSSTTPSARSRRPDLPMTESRIPSRAYRTSSSNGHLGPDTSRAGSPARSLTTTTGISPWPRLSRPWLASTPDVPSASPVISLI